MITTFTTSGFKCFTQPTTFHFARFNLLTGYNGRGKSSVLQALLLLSQSIKKYGHVETLSPSGCFLKLGSFGDILSDEASMISGSIGMLASASLATGKMGLYEPIHGSAPDIAGQQKANPLATVWSASQLLDFFGRAAEVERVTLREIEILQIDTQEEKMYAVLEELEQEGMTLLPVEDMQEEPEDPEV